MSLDAYRDKLLEEVARERNRQDTKWGGVRHDENLSPHDWFELIDDYNAWARRMALMRSRTKARKRYIQVAALALAAIEALDRGITEPTL